MSINRSKGAKRTVSIMSSSVIPSQVVIDSLLDCYNFLTPHEYSDKTLGILAFLLRKSVGTINFSDVIDAVEKRNKQGSATDFIVLLEEKRQNLPETDASIEDCLMLNRLITYIKENDKKFSMIHSHIRLYMRQNLVDQSLRPIIQYPQDFREREADYTKLKQAQDMRRLFYFSRQEVQKSTNLISLQTRITEHLNYLLDSKMNNIVRLEDTIIKELERIFANSFMIIDHPRSGINPVLIYKRIEPGTYRANVSMKIICLLHDFMQTHPDLIQIYNAELSLHPKSNIYPLDQSQKLLWKICHLRACLGNKPQLIYYAVLDNITFRQISKKDIRMDIAQTLYTLKIMIKLHINLPTYQLPIIQEVTLETLPFAISQHKNQIPQLLSRILLADIKQFSTHRSIRIETIVTYILRYFTHRTGIEPRTDQKIYLEQELNKARSLRKHFRDIEDIFLDFLVPYVSQVEFMAKHPILAMFYADGLFLGPCDSERTVEAMKKPPETNLLKIALRFNSIQVPYETIAKMPVLGRIIQLKTCAVRIDILNHRDQSVRHHTFDPLMLCNDIHKFVLNSCSANVRHKQVLYDVNEEDNNKRYKSFVEFAKYWNIRLEELSRYEEKYRLIYDSGRNLTDSDSVDSLLDDDDGDYHDNSSCDHQSATSGYATTYHEERMDDILSADEVTIDNNYFGNKTEEKAPIIHSSYNMKEQLQIPYYSTITQCSTNVTENKKLFPRNYNVTVSTQSASTMSTIENTTMQSRNQSSVNRISSLPFQNPSILSHPIGLSKTSNDSLVVESTLTCNTRLVSLTLSTTREHTYNRNKPRYYCKLPRDSSVSIVYLGAHSSTLQEDSSTVARKLIVYDNEYECIAKLSSEKQHIVYLIISATLARLVIPLIHDYIWIEDIYIHQDYDIIQSITWMDGYPKIRNRSNSLKEILVQIEHDITSIETGLSNWSSTADIFSELWTQKFSTTSNINISDDIKQMCKMPTIVTLCSIQPLPFNISKEGLRTHKFNTVEDCHTFLKQQSMSSIFLIIIDDENLIPDQVESLIKQHSVYTSYIFHMEKNDKYQQTMISMFYNPKISGILNNKKDLLVQMTVDISFFCQIPIYTPNMTMIKVEFDILATIDTDKQAFLNFQFLIDILRQLWSEPNVPLKLSDAIRASSTNLSEDLHMNSIQLIQEINKLNHQFNPAYLFKACSHFHLINQQIESSMQKAYPFSTTIYRAQLLSNKDIQTIEKNIGYLLNIHTLVLACRSFASTKYICRRARDCGLTIVMLEISIPKEMPLSYLDHDTIIFPLSTVFKIISVVKGPDEIYHVRLELADMIMDLIKERLYFTIHYRLTWLTFIYYSICIKNDEIAKEYFEYLLSILLDMDELESINDDELKNIFIKAKAQENFDSLAEIKKLLDSNIKKINHVPIHSPFDTELEQHEALAALYEQMDDRTYACLFYEKALKSTSNLNLRKLYQLKIESLNVQRN